MKQTVKSIMMMVTTVFVVLIVISCQREANNEVLMLEQNQAQAFSDELGLTTNNVSTVYHLAPSSGYTRYSSSSEIIPAHYGQPAAVGGVLRARLIERVSNSTFRIEISKQDGSAFSSAGTALVRVKSTAGSQAASASIVPGVTSVQLLITGTFAKGVVHFYPLVQSSNGTTYYAEPFMMYTVPMYTIQSAPYVTGSEIGRVDDVVVKAAGPDLYHKKLLSVQCTDFCNRYYQNVYGKNIVNSGRNGGDATYWYANGVAKGLRQIAHGSMDPRVGDILCMGGGSDKYGHVAIIIEVTDTYITIAQQNGHRAHGNHGWNHAIGGRLPYNSLSRIISPPSGYTIHGLLRL